VPDLRTLRTIGLAVVLMSLGACAVRGPIGDKAGGAPGDPVVLRMAVSSSGPLRGVNALFVREVRALSGGNVRIETIYEWGAFTPTNEQQLVRAVAAGAVDVGIVSSVVFDTMGNRSFQALTAPGLVDSYGLQGAILRSGIADRMLDSLPRNGVDGLAMLAGSLTHPVGVKGPLLGPSDWGGIRFGTSLSNGQFDVARALGARPRAAPGTLRWRLLTLGELQGYGYGLFSYATNSSAQQLSKYLTANVVLWPSMAVLLANPDSLGALTGRQLGWLEGAARIASARSTRIIRAERDLTTRICRLGSRFADADPADLAWMRRALAPVTSSLEQDPVTRSLMERIRALKRTISPEPPLAIPKDCFVRGRDSA
jgi:TRAP-type transport system periplasmic protein